MSEERARRKTSWADESTITLRGLRVAWAPERVVPWAELVAHKHNGDMQVWSIDSEGERLRIGERPVGWSVGMAHQRTVVTMIRRGQRRALESGQYFVTVNRSRWTRLFGVLMV
ncbi:MAG: hypothetical protein K2Q20_11735, partial [Phycisphaerales bacterium]|nr:hypothetical protein [Phycisphaerales bacterium]